ncbi:MAG: TIGR04283 family arsenosugar biosynthesis glycosyltransferase [Gammaproteobacteria bacterium]
MNLNKISIIIPTLNEEPNILGVLKPLQVLRHSGLEIILVDGGSTDATVPTAENLVDSLISAPPGRARQMNTGARYATGEFLLFLHADSLLPDNAANLIIETLQKKQHQWGRFNIKLNGKSRLLRVVEFMMNVRSRLSGIATGDQGIFITRACFNQIGGYPDIPLMEDVALSKTLKERVGRPACLKDTILTSSRRWENNGILSTVLLMWRIRIAYFFGTDPGKLAKRYQ